MGCGQSKIHLYPRKSKSKNNGKKSGHVDAEADPDEDEGNNMDDKENHNKHLEKSDEHKSLHHDGNGSPEPHNGEIPLPLWWPQLEHRNKGLSSSQLDFFRMLDQKIEEGPDYDSTNEKEIALEDIRISELLERWESASITTSMCSSTSRSLQNTPVRQQMSSLRQQMRLQPLSAELLSQHQQQQLKHQQLQLQQQPILQSNSSPKRDGRSLLSQTIIHQSYGVTTTQKDHTAEINQRLWSSPSLLRAQQNQQQPFVGQYQLQQTTTSAQSPQQPSEEPRFPQAISVQRLAPQVQRQIREAQELIKESCPHRYNMDTTGSPGPPIRSQQRTRRTQLETHYSQELS